MYRATGAAGSARRGLAAGAAAVVEEEAAPDPDPAPSPGNSGALPPPTTSLTSPVCCRPSWAVVAAPPSAGEAVDDGIEGPTIFSIFSLPPSALAAAVAVADASTGDPAAPPPPTVSPFLLELDLLKLALVLDAALERLLLLLPLTAPAAAYEPDTARAPLERLLAPASPLFLVVVAATLAVAAGLLVGVAVGAADAAAATVEDGDALGGAPAGGGSVREGGMMTSSPRHRPRPFRRSSRHTRL